MRLRKIPPLQWTDFLGNFGFRHFGWHVTLEKKSKKSRAAGELLAAGHSFLEELMTEGTDDDKQITIVLGSPFQPFHSHVVGNPRCVRVSAGAQSELEIDSADGSTVVMRCRRP